MPLFAIRCLDDPRDPEGVARRRREARDDHFAHVERVVGAIRVSGPLKDEDGRYVGSLFVVEAADAAAAREWLTADPYHRAGIWGEIEVTGFVAAAGEWVGGTVW